MEEIKEYPSLVKSGADERPMVISIVAYAAYDYALSGRLIRIYKERGLEPKTSSKLRKALRLFGESKTFFNSAWFRILTSEKIDPQSIIEICEKAINDNHEMVIKKNGKKRDIEGQWVREGNVEVNIVQGAADIVSKTIAEKLGGKAIKVFI